MSEPGTDLPSETKTFETDIKTKTSPQSASPRREKSTKKKAKKMSKPFSLNVANSEIPDYNSLMDENLLPFFANKKITKGGEIIEKKTKSITHQDTQVSNPKTKKYSSESKTTLVKTYKLPPISKKIKKSQLNTESEENFKSVEKKVTTKIELIPYSQKLSLQKFEYFVPDSKLRKSSTSNELKSAANTFRSPKGVKLAPISTVTPNSEKVSKPSNTEHTQNTTEKPENELPTNQ